jgi:hypothetical protein
LQHNNHATLQRNNHATLHATEQSRNLATQQLRATFNATRIKKLRTVKIRAGPSESFTLKCRLAQFLTIFGIVCPLFKTIVNVSSMIVYVDFQT